MWLLCSIPGPDFSLLLPCWEPSPLVLEPTRGRLAFVGTFRLVSPHLHMLITSLSLSHKRIQILGRNRTYIWQLLACMRRPYKSVTPAIVSICQMALLAHTCHITRPLESISTFSAPPTRNKSLSEIAFDLHSTHILNFPVWIRSVSIVNPKTSLKFCI